MWKTVHINVDDNVLFNLIQTINEFYLKHPRLVGRGELRHTTAARNCLTKIPFAWIEREAQTLWWMSPKLIHRFAQKSCCYFFTVKRAEESPSCGRGYVSIFYSLILLWSGRYFPFCSSSMVDCPCNAHYQCLDVYFFTC